MAYKNILFLVFLSLIITVLFGDIANVHAAPQSKVLYLQIKEAKLRSEPKFWALGVADLSYGAELTPLSAISDNSGWLKVKFGSTEGYIHSTAVTSRKVILKSLENVDNKVDTSTAVLAGKGFNSQIESSYASAHGVSYASVDEVAALKIDSARFLTFLHDGKLNEQ